MRLLSRVYLVMLSKIRAHPEGFSTLVTLIGLLARVDPSVLTEDRALTKGLPTHPTHIGFLASVDSLMLKEVGAPAEALPTLDAYVRFFSARSCWVLSECLALLRQLAITVAIRVWADCLIRSLIGSHQSQIQLCILLLLFSLTF